MLQVKFNVCFHVKNPGAAWLIVKNIKEIVWNTQYGSYGEEH